MNINYSCQFVVYFGESEIRNPNNTWRAELSHENLPSSARLNLTNDPGRSLRKRLVELTSPILSNRRRIRTQDRPFVFLRGL